MQAEHVAVEEAVRRWFTEDEQARWPLGKVGEFAQLQAAAGKDDRLVRADFHHRISRIDVLQVGDGQALVDFRAREVTEITHRDFGLRRFVRSFDGPLTLRKVDGEWRVEDFCVDGRPRSKAIFLLQRASLTVRDVTVSLRAVVLDARATRAILEVDNGSSSPVLVARAALGRPWLRGWSLYRGLAIVGPRTVAVGESLLVRASRKMRGFPLDTTSVALGALVVDPETDERRRFFIRTPLVEEAGAASETSESFPLDIRLAGRIRPTGALALLIAVPVSLAALRNWTYLGVILVAEGGGFLTVLKHARRRPRLAARFALMGLVLVGLGILSMASGSGGIGV